MSSESSHIVDTKPKNINYIVINKDQSTSQKNLLISNLVKKFSNKQNTISSNINRTINNKSYIYLKLLYDFYLMHIDLLKTLSTLYS